jgi:hypothetical protein
VRNFFFLLFVPLGSALYAQNLIQNNGFENGITWWSPTLWTRDTNAGRIDIVDSTSSEGTKSLRLEHWGSQDYAFMYSSSFPAVSGDYYVLSADIRAEKIKNGADISVALFSSSGKSIIWDYGSRYFTQAQGVFVRYTSRFLIPDSTAYFQVRCIGYDSTLIFIDNVSLTKETDVVDKGKYSVVSGKYTIDVTTPGFSVKVTNSSGTSYQIEPLTDFIALKDSVLLNSNQIVATAQFVPEAKNCHIVVEAVQDGFSMEMRADSGFTISSDFMFPGFIKNKPGDYFIVPYAEGLIFPVEEQFPFGNFRLNEWKATCGFVGVTDFTKGYMIVAEKPFNARFQFFQPTGQSLYAAELLNENSKGVLEYNRKAYFLFSENGGYVGLAQKYHTLATQFGYVVPFTQKLNQNSSIRTLQGAVDIYLYAAASMNTESFVDSLYNYGLRDVMLSDEGVPVDCIDTMNARGFLSGRYEDLFDVYPPNISYPDDIIVNSDESLKEGFLGSVQGYSRCSKTHKAYVNNTLHANLATHHYRFRFIDVEMADGFFECYSTTHPTTKKVDGENRYETLRTVKEDFQQVVGSEEAREYTFPVCDFGEGTMSIVPPIGSGYDWATPTSDPGADFINYSMNHKKRIPLVSLIYRDCHFSTWYTGDGLSKVPDYWDKKEAFNILYGSMALTVPPSANYWQENKVRYITSNIAVGALLRMLEFRKMTDHRFLTDNRDVQMTNFEGFSVTANFGSSDYAYSDGTNAYVIPQYGYVGSDSKGTVVKVKQNQKTLTAAVTDSLYFISPQEETTFQGVTSSGALSMRRFEHGFRVAFIGEQDSFILETGQLRWIITIVGYTTLGGVPATIDTISPGIYRLHKSGVERFYILSTRFEDKDIRRNKTSGPIKYELKQNYPNPFNPSTSFSFSMEIYGSTSLRLYDVLGREVAVIFSKILPAGSYTKQWNAEGLSSGIYFYRLQAGSFTDTKKLVLLR